MQPTNPYPNPSGPFPPTPGSFPNLAQPNPGPAQNLNVTTPTSQVPPAPQTPPTPAPDQPYFNPLQSANLIGKTPTNSIAKTIVIIVLSLIAVTFIGLFIWMYDKWDKASTNLNGQIDTAVAVAVEKNTAHLQNEFAEKEKFPKLRFAGPVDYGELSFLYPKTWSLYEAKSAANGGDYEAYLHPGKVPENGTNTINALRVTIRNQAFDKVVAELKNSVTQGNLALSIKTINKENANLYRGKISDNLQGLIAIIRIRDKTAILQTDALIYEKDFQEILDSVSYNK